MDVALLRFGDGALVPRPAPTRAHARARGVGFAARVNALIPSRGGLDLGYGVPKVRPARFLG